MNDDLIKLVVGIAVGTVSELARRYFRKDSKKDILLQLLIDELEACKEELNKCREKVESLQQ